VMDDRRSMVEALHERVLAVLGESDLPPTPLRTADGPLFDTGFAATPTGPKVT